ncbi:hypothetical protein AB0M43_36360 [Longispora sp. NPDC051575]
MPNLLGLGASASRR